jgi:diaminopropionate ammonia-lyase
VARDVGIAATVYVPGFMSAYTRELLRGEGADVRVLEGGSYDDSIAAAREDAAATGALMVMDVSWEGYEEVPKVGGILFLGVCSPRAGWRLIGRECSG